MSNTVKKIILLILLIAILSFIFGNSLLSREESSEISGRWYLLLKPILDTVLGVLNKTDTPVRKMAHFFEFSCLGLVLCQLFCLYKKDYLRPLFCGVLFALTDETIQYFTDRGSKCVDVWLDFSAIVLMVFIIYGVRNKIILKGKLKSV